MKEVLGRKGVQFEVEDDGIARFKFTFLTFQLFMLLFFGFQVVAKYLKLLFSIFSKCEQIMCLISEFRANFHH